MTCVLSSATCARTGFFSIGTAPRKKKRAPRRSASRIQPAELRDPDDAIAHDEFAARALRHVLRGDWRHHHLGNPGQLDPGPSDWGGVCLDYCPRRSPPERLFPAGIFFGDFWPAPGLALRQPAP